MALEYDNYYYLRGKNLYERLTDSGKVALDRRAAAALSSDDIKALVIAIHHFKGRSEVALNTLMVILDDRASLSLQNLNPMLFRLIVLFHWVVVIDALVVGLGGLLACGQSEVVEVIRHAGRLLLVGRQ